jgi:hypothetical protein
MLSKARKRKERRRWSRARAGSELGDAEADAADEEIGGALLGREFDELDGVFEGAGTQDKAAGLKGDMAEEELGAEADGIEVGAGRFPGDEGVVVAVEDDDGAEAEDGVHGEGLRAGNTDSDKSVPGAAADSPAGGEGGEPAFGEEDGFQNSPGRDNGGGRGGGMRDERNAVHGAFLIPFRGRGGRGKAGDDVFNTDGLGEEDAIQRGEAKAAAAMEEVGDVRLRKSGLTGEEGCAENTKVNTAPNLQPEALVQLEKFHLLEVFKELYTHYLRDCSKNCIFASSVGIGAHFGTQFPIREESRRRAIDGATGRH